MHHTHSNKKNTKNILDINYRVDSTYQTPVFEPLLTIAHAKGDYLYDVRGRRFIDLTGGIAVHSLGHGALSAQLVAAQLQKTSHVSNYFTTEPLLQLCKRLVLLANKYIPSVPYKSTFVCNSGTEAIETALKFCLLWKYKREFRHKKHVLYAHNSFHGRTMGALSLTGQARYRRYFEPLLAHTRSFVYNDARDIAKKCSRKTIALFIEAIQGEGGLSMLDSSTAEHIMKLKQKYNFLIVADEVQGGLWRTGTPFACQHSGLKPDIIVIAKPLGGGLPIGAVITPQQVHDLLSPGDHGSTFGGNPVVCTAAHYMLDKFLDPHIQKKRERSAQALDAHIHALTQKYSDLIPLGRGHLRGLAFRTPRIQGAVSDIIAQALHRGLLILRSGGTKLRFAPSLICEDYVYQEAFNILDSILHEYIYPHPKPSHTSQH